jgi:tyrosinase
VRVHRGVPILELDNWLAPLCFMSVKKNSLFTDAPDFYESTFWSDTNPESGLGGWGNPNADFSVPNGGFSSLHVSYPSPHILRRNFTLQPFQGFAPPFNTFFTQPLKEANSSFLAPEIEQILETSAGDYKGFQEAFETFEVRKKELD